MYLPVGGCWDHGPLSGFPRPRTRTGTDRKSDVLDIAQGSDSKQFGPRGLQAGLVFRVAVVYWQLVRASWEQGHDAALRKSRAKDENERRNRIEYDLLSLVVKGCADGTNSTGAEKKKPSPVYMTPLGNIPKQSGQSVEYRENIAEPRSTPSEPLQIHSLVKKSWTLPFFNDTFAMHQADQVKKNDRFVPESMWNESGG